MLKTITKAIERLLVKFLQSDWSAASVQLGMLQNANYRSSPDR